MGDLRRKLGVIAFALAVVLGSVVAATPVGSAAAAAVPLQAVNPVRLFDTRPGEDTIDGQGVGIGQRPPRSTTTVQIAGRGGVPVNASAAVINLTAIFPTQDTYLSVFPCGTKRPNVSNLNSPAGDIRANTAVVKLSSKGTVCVYTVAPTDFIIDINGYVPSGGTPITVNPVRLFDSRPGQKTIDGKGVGIGQRSADSTTTVQIAGRGGVPRNASTAVINLTAVFPTQNTYLSVFPCGTKRPNVSNLNSPAGDIRANSVVVKLSPKGTVCVYTVAPTDFIIDINGYALVGGAPKSINPARLFDTRPGERTIDGEGVGPAPAQAGSITPVQIAGRGGVPRNAAAAVINLTAVLPSENTYLSVFPCYTERPNVSNLNSSAGDIRANSTLVKLAADGTVCVYTVAPTDFIIDVNGYTPLSPQTDCVINGVPVRTGLPKTECEALVKIYTKTRTPEWFHYGWGTATTPCSWSGVTCEWGHVRGLTISGGIAGALPPEIANLTYLDVLELSGGLTSIPPEIGKLPGLVVLNLSYNQLKRLPPEIGDISTLASLGVSSNRLTSLPPELGNLLNLGELGAEENQLTSLPPEIGNLTDLVGLDLSYNQLTSLPPTIANLTQLEVLDLMGNKFTSLPPTFASLTQLSQLHLEDNQLTSLPANFGNLSKLYQLFLTNNQLTTLPAGFGKLVNLDLAWLNNNKLSGDITAALTPLMSANKITSLGLSGNRCLSTTNPRLAAWLTRIDAEWKTGCS